MEKSLYINKNKYNQLTLLYNCIVTSIAPRLLQKHSLQCRQDNSKILRQKVTLSKKTKCAQLGRQRAGLGTGRSRVRVTWRTFPDILITTIYSFPLHTNLHYSTKYLSPLHTHLHCILILTTYSYSLNLISTKRIWYSQTVTHPSANHTQRCLTSLIGREVVCLTYIKRNPCSK